MTWFPLLVVLSLLVCVSSNPILSQRELAPSLVLDRINLLRDSIEKLQQMNTKVRCQIKDLEHTGIRSKRYVGPAQRLDEMIGMLQFSDMMPQMDDC